MKLERVQALKLPYGPFVSNVLGTRRGLFLSDSEKYMCRIDPDDYTVSWEIPWKRNTWQRLVGDTLIANHGATVWGLNPDTGEIVWEHAASGCVERGEGRLILFVESGHIIIDSQTGEVERRVTTPSFLGFPARTFSDCEILRSDDNQTLRAFDFDSQQVRWELSPRRHPGLGDRHSTCIISTAHRCASSSATRPARPSKRLPT